MDTVWRSFQVKAPEELLTKVVPHQFLMQKDNWLIKGQYTMVEWYPFFFFSSNTMIPVSPFPSLSRRCCFLSSQ